MMLKVIKFQKFILKLTGAVGASPVNMAYSIYDLWRYCDNIE